MPSTRLVSFEAAWAQMLNYIATIAVSAFFVPHYLSVFWAPLRENPWDIVGGVVVIAALVILNIVGVQESAKVNVVLAVPDFATQLLLVLLGFVLVFSPHVLVSNVHLGVAPTLDRLLPLDSDRDARLHRYRDRLEHVGGGARPAPDRAPRGAVRRDRRLRHLLHAAVGGALGDAGVPHGGARLHDLPRPAADRPTARGSPATRTTRCSGSSTTSDSARASRTSFASTSGSSPRRSSSSARMPA